MSKLLKGLNLWAARILKNGGIGVLPTDTIYGMAGLALDKKVVQRIYKLRKRNPKKPMIILISSVADLKLFGVKLSSKIKKFLSKIWPNKISVILPLASERARKNLFYLHRGAKKLAFRLPKNKKLIALINKTGPLVAPSANFEGMPPADNIKEAKKYFGDKIDFYVDNGAKKSLPSTLIEIKNGKIIILRQGAAKIAY